MGFYYISIKVRLIPFVIMNTCNMLTFNDFSVIHINTVFSDLFLLCIYLFILTITESC